MRFWQENLPTFERKLWRKSMSVIRFPQRFHLEWNSQYNEDEALFEKPLWQYFISNMGRSMIEWTVEINKNMLTSVKRCLLFSRLWRLCQAIKSMHKQKCIAFSILVSKDQKMLGAGNFTLLIIKTLLCPGYRGFCFQTPPPVPVLWVCLRAVTLVAGKTKCYPVIRGIWAKYTPEFSFMRTLQKICMFMFQSEKRCICQSVRKEEVWGLMNLAWR